LLPGHAGMGWKIRGIFLGSFMDEHGIHGCQALKMESFMDVARGNRSDHIRMMIYGRLWEWRWHSLGFIKSDLEVPWIFEKVWFRKGKESQPETYWILPCKFGSQK
jgi:hypothetical protein